MNKREAGLVARAIELVLSSDGRDLVEAVRILRRLSREERPTTKADILAAFNRTPIKAKRSKPRRGRVIDKPYKAWIASLPCLICVRVNYAYLCVEALMEILFMGSTSRRYPDAEVAHVGIRGLGQKCSDRETVPLCKQHHTEGKESERALGKRFWSFHGLDKAEMIKALNAEFERRAA